MRHVSTPHVGLANALRVLLAAVGVLALGVAAVALAPPAPCQRETGPVASPAAVPDPAGRNVLLITADDMRASDLRLMPFTSGAFRRRGVTFADAISPYPLCCPARAQIVTGQYNHNNGVMGNLWPHGGYWALRDRHNTLPVWLTRHGYLTGFVGKYMNEYGRPPGDLPGPIGRLRGRCADEVPRGWRHWYASVGIVHDYTRVTLNVDTPRTQPHAVEVDRYQADHVGELTAGLIRRFHRARRPFFIWASHLAPHSAYTSDGWRPPVPATRDEGAYARLPLPTSGAYRDALNAPATGKLGPMRGRGPLSRAGLLREHRLRAESLLALDRAVRQAVRQLRRSHEYANTVIIFTSDNGYALGEHRYRGKDSPYEPSLRVPMIVNAPRIERRYTTGRVRRLRTVPHTVTTTDIAATIVGVTGARPGRALDGIDMTRPAQNPDDRPGGDRAVLIESGPLTEAPAVRQRFVGVRTDRWTWFAWRWGAAPRRHAGAELYDRRIDPAQTHNLMGSSPAGDRLRRLTYLMRDCRGAACVRSAP